MRRLPVVLLVVLGAAGVATAAPRGLERARERMRVGDLAGARAAAEKAGKGADARVLLAEIDRATGRYAEARTLLEQVVKKDPRNLRARCQLGLVYEETGEKELASRIWNRFFDDHDAHRIDETKAEPLMYLAIAAEHLEDFQGANETLHDAVEKDPKLLEANIAWGWLFLTKYDAADAETSFAEVLKIDPQQPDAHAGMARVKLEQGYDVAGATAEIGKALAVNPHHPRALLIRAEMEIDNGDYARAQRTVDEVLAVNPNHVEAHTLLAAAHWLDDDPAGFEAERKKVFAVNRRYAKFFDTVADFAVKRHRYQEAIDLEKKALQIDPRSGTALAGIGIGYLRMGEEDKGLKYLDQAFDRDHFNVRTYNLLNLFEKWIPEKYELTTPASGRGLFRLRVPKDERVMIERYIPRTLVRAFDDMVKRYGFRPTVPVTIELYDDPDYYSVRTVGLPNVAALGVCFGKVITALSPSNGNLNWGMILWHELGHVFAIQLSRSRVPRWYTEGLSEYETLIARREWRRENDIDVYLAYQAGTLPSIGDLNTRFLHAKDMADMVVAYHLSSVAIEFIARRWGFPKLVEGLRLYGQGKKNAEVLQTITGLTLPQLDAEFHKYLDRRLAVYKGQFRVRLSQYDDVTALEKAAAARPGDAETQANLALGYLAAGDGDKAQAAAKAALALDAKNRKALFVSGEIRVAHGDLDGAQQLYQDLIAAGGDGYDVRMRLARIARERGDNGAAEAELLRAVKLDPQRSEPHMALAQIYDKTNREDAELKELDKYVYLEQMEWAPLKKLIDKEAARKMWAKVREHGEMALFVNPFDADLHATLALAYEKTDAPDKAIYEYESALRSDPPLRRPAVAQLGLARIWLARRDTAHARKAVAEALRMEPENAEALALSKKLK